MKHIFILNSFSLKKRTLEIENRISKAAKKLKLEFIIETNSENISTEEIIKKYANSQNVIYAVGGDGQVNRVLNAIVNTKNKLGLIPLGTGNDFYKTCEEMLTQGDNKVDLVKINDKYFINIACFGIDAVVGNNTEIIHSKIIPKNQRYNISLLYHFFTYKPRKMTVICNDKKITKNFSTIVVCNGRYYGGGYKVGQKSSILDDKLDVYLFDSMSKLNMAKLILGMKKGQHENSKKLIKFSTKKLEIISENKIESNVDGEKMIAKTFKIEIMPKKQSLYFNKELIREIYEN